MLCIYMCLMKLCNIFVQYPHIPYLQYKQMLPFDQLKLITCLLLTLPLSHLLTFTKKPTYFLALTCLASAILQLIVFQEWIVILWVQQNVVYVLCKYGPRRKIGGIVMGETFGVLVLVQLARMYLSYGVENVDITAIFMMQVFQYVSFSFNYQDGLGREHTAFTIKELPPYAQYLGYVLFIPSCLIGPVFQFNDFHHYVHKTGIYQQVSPGFGLPGVRKQLKTTIFSIAFFILLAPFPLSYMLTPEYTQHNYLIQCAYLLVSIIGCRFKYYAAWSLGMVGMHLTGFTYNPTTDQFGKVSNNWDRIVVSNIWDFQMDPSMKKKADGWNIPIQVALKRYIYDRINKASETSTPKERKRLQIEAQQKTLAVSALWHGLYPGYFLAFFHWALILQISQELFRIQKNSGKLKKWRHKLHYVELILVNYFLGYFGVCFQLMTWQKIHTFFAATNYIPVIIAYIANILIVRMAIFSRKSERMQHKESQKSDSTQEDKKEKGKERKFEVNGGEIKIVGEKVQ